MASLSDIGNLKHLYLDEIEPGEATTAPAFLIQASAQVLNERCDRNWVDSLHRANMNQLVVAAGGRCI